MLPWQPVSFQISSKKETYDLDLCQCRILNDYFFCLLSLTWLNIKINNIVFSLKKIIYDIYNQRRWPSSDNKKKDNKHWKNGTIRNCKYVFWPKINNRREKIKVWYLYCLHLVMILYIVIIQIVWLFSFLGNFLLFQLSYFNNFKTC